MTNDFDELKKLLRQEAPVEPHPSIRSQAIGAALQRFEFLLQKRTSGEADPTPEASAESSKLPSKSRRTTAAPFVQDDQTPEKYAAKEKFHEVGSVRSDPHASVTRRISCHYPERKADQAPKPSLNIRKKDPPSEL